mgnify:CR=1 FL=1
MPRARTRLWDQPILLLGLTSLIWAGHSVVGKLAVGEIGPMTLTFLRWSLAVGPILFAARHHLKADFRVMRRHWLYVASLGALGYTVFNALFYVSAYYTGALNMSLLTSFWPVDVARSAGLAALAALPPLRRFAIREGLTPSLAR